MSGKRLNATITIAGSVAGSLRSAFGSASKSITQLGSEVTRLNARQKELNRTIDDQAKLGRNASALKVRYAQDELRMVDKQIISLKNKLAVERKIANAQKANLAHRAEVGGKIVGAAGMAVGVGALVSGPVRVAIKFENAMLDVSKQLDGARDSGGKLTSVYFDMVESVKQLGRELPIPVNQIAEMVAAGLRMGVAKDQVIDFVKESAKMSTAFNLPVGELAEQMGKIAGLYGIPIPAIGALADSINYLDDNAMSKGGDIIEFLTRVGGVASAVKITGSNMAAIGSTMLSMGESTETAATATNSFFQRLAAAEKGTKDLREALAELGLNDTTIQKGMQTDALETMLTVLDRINRLSPNKRAGILVDLVGFEHSPKIAKLANNTEELRRQLSLANSEAAKGSMGREFAIRLAATSAQMEIAKNRSMELAGALGGALLPSINDTMGAMGPYVSKMAEWADKNPEWTKGIVGITGALVGLRIATLGATYAWTILNGTFLASPIGRVTAIAAIGAVMIWENWEPISGYFKSMWTEIGSVFDTTWSGITGAFRMALNELSRGIEWITQKYQTVRSAVSGFIGEGNQAGAAAVMDSMPGLPAPAPRGGTYQDNSQTSINVTQKPGESQQDLAKRVAEELERNRKARERAAMYDGAYAQ